MTDRETRNKILADKSLPIHRHYRGFYTKRDMLEQLLMGYTVTESAQELGLTWGSAMDAIKRLRNATGHTSTNAMIRGLVKKHRGYL